MSSEYDGSRNQHPSRLHDRDGGIDTMLDAYITRSLYERAEQVHFTPQLRDEILRKLPPRTARRPASRLVLAFAVVLVLVSLSAAYLLAFPKPSPSVALHYVVGQTYETPSQLAQQGQLLSVDPTMQRIVYAPAQQPGVLYTADLANAVKSNLLAMRDARDVTWSPDGSALVTTIVPNGVYLPLLALVPYGQFMHVLGHDAEAASWLPTSASEITFVTLSEQHIHLWSTTPDGATTNALATMTISDPVQRLSWSNDGHMLAMLVTKGASSSQPATSQPGNAIYMMDARSGEVHELISAPGSTITNIRWSPDGRYLTYEQKDAQGKTSLNATTVTGQALHFSLTIQHQLQGWSWSPDSRGLVYSDGGTLKTHLLRGSAIEFPVGQGSQLDPFWLSNGSILYLHVTNGVGRLETLTPATKN